MNMYYFDTLQTIRVDQKDDKFEYKTRKTLTTHLDPEYIDTIPTEKYKASLDAVLESKPGSIITAEEKSLEVGDLCKVGSSVFKIRSIINNENLSINVLSKYGRGKRSDSKKDLSEDDCEVLGLEYEPGLYPFSKMIKLSPYDPNRVDYVDGDLGTYTLSCTHKNTIRYMILCINGFSRTADERIIECPGGELIDIELFIVSLRIRFKKDIPSISNYTGWKSGEDLSWRIIYDKFPGSERATDYEICDVNGRIFIIIKLVKNEVGISPLSVKGLSASDIFDISWDSSFSLGNKGSGNTERVELRSIPPIYDKNIFEEDMNNSFWRSVYIDSTGEQKLVPLIRR